MWYKALFNLESSLELLRSRLLYWYSPLSATMNIYASSQLEHMVQKYELYNNYRL